MIVVSSGFSTYSQTATNSHTEPGTIEVVGSAEKEIVADEIYISITIRERESGKDQITIDQQEADLKGGLQRIGVDLENLSLSDANANYLPIKWSKKDVITRKIYELKVEDALMVGKVFEVLDELKITEAHIARVSHSKVEVLKKEVRIMAIKAAKEKADYLLEAIGQTTGRALKVNEQYLENKLDAPYLNMRSMANRRPNDLYYVDGLKMNSIDSDRFIQFEKIKLQSSIHVIFEIK
tara:strand:- start:311 stop:1024 length:714 start_codon:yes stop_codon:yes gene_type:complete